MRWQKLQWNAGHDIWPAGSFFIMEKILIAPLTLSCLNVSSDILSCLTPDSSSPTSSFPLVRHLPNGQTVPLLPSPVQMTSVISVSSLKIFQKKKSTHIHKHLNLYLFFESLQGRQTRCQTSLGFQDHQWAGPAAGHLPHPDTACIQKLSWWDFFHFDDVCLHNVSCSVLTLCAMMDFFFFFETLSRN